MANQISDASVPLTPLMNKQISFTVRKLLNTFFFCLICKLIIENKRSKQKLKNNDN